MKKSIIILSALLAAVPVFAQSRAFKLGKYIEIQAAVLKELNRSYVDTLPMDRLEKKAVEAMLAELDPYTVYVPQEDNADFEMMINKVYGGIGAIIYKPDKEGNVIINEPYAGSPAVKAGIRCADEILSIDGVSTHGLTASECSAKMRGEPGSKVLFEIKKARSGELTKVEVTRERIHIPDIDYYGMLNEKDGYILISGFTEGLAAEVRKDFRELKSQGMKRLVIDLRGNGGGIMQEAIGIVGLFVPKGSVVVTSRGNEAMGEQVYRTTSEPEDQNIPIIVMVDGGSASSSEIVAGALQDLDRATIMGTRTFGKGLVQSIRPLPYNGQLKITTAKYYTPSGRCVQAIDYSHRNEDGSVGHIPDSLTHEFKTLKGRSVRDGGGIKPDVEIKGKEYSRLSYSLVLNGITEQYAIEFVRKHETIAQPKDFHLSDADFEDFIAFAKGREFDYRSSARAIFDQMRAALKKDGIEDSMSTELDALKKALDMDKETFLRLKKDEIVPFLEQEIVVRYYFVAGGAELNLRYDDALRTALVSKMID
ncbi:MAG: S41 family peptidase [Bacteroidales bacterium]|nr:S41 family peptidase [Bacteroidales bacterium]